MWFPMASTICNQTIILKENYAMPLACIYHKVHEMRVVPLTDLDKWLATGEWFNHPSCKKEELNHEKSIRQSTRKGRSNGDDSSKKAGSGT